MQLAIQMTTVFLFCLYHLPALSSLCAYQASSAAYRARHLWLGCLLYLTVFCIISSFIAELLALFLPKNCVFLFSLIPAALLLTLPKNRKAANHCANSYQMLTASPVTGTVTYLLAQCGEACSLLLFLPLVARQDFLLYPFIFLGFGIAIVAGRYFSATWLRKSNTYFLLQFCVCLCFFVLFLLITRLQY